MLKLTTVLILFLSSVASVAYFAPWSGGHWGVGGSIHSISAPEIDPSSAVAALTLLLGGITVLRSRVARK